MGEQGPNRDDHKDEHLENSGGSDDDPDGVQNTVIEDRSDDHHSDIDDHDRVMRSNTGDLTQ